MVVFSLWPSLGCSSSGCSSLCCFSLGCSSLGGFSLGSEVALALGEGALVGVPCLGAQLVGLAGLEDVLVWDNLLEGTFVELGCLLDWGPGWVIFDVVTHDLVAQV